ncbi:hypothetical protein [Rhizobium halophytocola]|uniref:Uncharacterized protein n=1 Tax=Rhizobium halophytocola TaxID=735519 RepID=A0ABS4E081_9HYPH|nr:hypothetical protein [Rhizobium halophytocola]MBP1851350.1 hypothetical protein [Rhizobium halophytocola]
MPELIATACPGQRSAAAIDARDRLPAAAEPSMPNPETVTRQGLS